MNETTLNNTATIRGDSRVGGFILVERVGDRCWRAREWSAFFASLVLPEGCCKCYQDDCGDAVAEFSANGVFMLSERLEVHEQQTAEQTVFSVPRNLAISEMAFRRWKSKLQSHTQPVLK